MEEAHDTPPIRALISLQRRLHLLTTLAPRLTRLGLPLPVQILVDLHKPDEMRPPPGRRLPQVPSEHTPDDPGENQARQLREEEHR